LEIWSGQEDVIKRFLDEGAVEPKAFIGVIGEEGWQIPKYTAKKCDDLVSSAGSLGDCTVYCGIALDKFDSEVFTMVTFSGLFWVDRSWNVFWKDPRPSPSMTSDGGISFQMRC